jgi:hypothetical protein
MRKQTITRPWHERGDLVVQPLDRKDIDPDTAEAYLLIEDGRQIGTVQTVVGPYGLYHYAVKIGDLIGSGKSIREAVLTTTGRADYLAAKTELAELEAAKANAEQDGTGD